MVVVAAVVRVAGMIRRNLSIHMLCHGIVWVVVMVSIVVVCGVSGGSYIISVVGMVVV